jgi:clan AA aspartic protease (TIGR02281 family)
LGLLVIEGRMLRVFFNVIALVFAITWIGEASAQSSLPRCPPKRYVWNWCVGAYTFRDGTNYVGGWNDDELNGQGTFTWPDGTEYVGEFRDNKFNGKGSYTSPDGWKYVGEYRDDKRNGQGTLTSPGGQKYVGEFRDGKKSGRGTMTFPDGGKYVGDWSDGTYSGQGTLTSPDGTKYVGEYRDGDRNGQGTYTWPGGQKYVGYWRGGRMNGQGTLTLSDGAKYIGAWRADKKHGQGREYSSNGELAREGYWVSDAYYGSKRPDNLSDENSGRVKVVESGGIYHVPVVINDALKLDFMVDSGAADVCIPADVALTLMRTGSIKKSDFIGTETYRLADGSTVSSRTFIIRSLTVGDRTVTDVRASIADVTGPLLLGQSFLKRFKSWSQDNAAHELILE